MIDPAVESAYRFLRDHTRGDLQFEEHVRPIKYVISPEGQLVAPVMVAMLQALETVLFVPECVEDALELLVTLTEFDEHGPEGALADRWRIHHGEPPDVRWALIDIDAAKQEGIVIDGDVLMRPNPLTGAEAKVCKTMNQRPDVLRTLCLHQAHIEIESPIMVGLDESGIDVRGRFDVVHVRAEHPFEDADDAIARLMEMHGRFEGKPHPAETTSEQEAASPTDGIG